MTEKTNRSETDTWTEKYRPRLLKDVAHQEQVVHMLQKALQGADLPHLLFYGPPGTGKTSAALAFCYELFPKHTVFKDRVLEMNASDERGIAAVREKISTFCHRSVGPASEKTPRFKIVILDEVDAMTRIAQSAMRRVIEDCSGNTRFILICNYVSRLISPIVSRCTQFRFNPLPEAAQIERLRTICGGENFVVSDEEMRKLIEKTEGDLRRAVACLQSLAPILDGATQEKRDKYFDPAADKELVDKTVKIIRSSDVKTILDSVENISRHCSGVAFFKSLVDELMSEEMINDENIAVLGEHAALCEKRIMDGCSLRTVLLDFMLKTRANA